MTPCWLVCHRPCALSRATRTRSRLPADAVLLMSSERCPHQMIRIGQSWGVQFHPEVEPERVRRWDSDRLRSLGFDPATVNDEAERYAVELEKTWSAVFGRFLDLTD